MKKELVDIDGPLRAEDAKIKVTLYLDGDVLKAAKARAKSENMKYQTLVNDALREIFLAEKPVKKELKDIIRRIELLEAKQA